MVDLLAVGGLGLVALGCCCSLWLLNVGGRVSLWEVVCDCLYDFVV